MTLYLDPADVVAALRRGDPGLLAGAAVVYAASWALRGVRYRTILDELGYPSRLGVLTGAIFISQSGNLVFPARAGDALRAYVVKKRRNVPYPTGVASLSVERVFDLLTITALAGGVLVVALATGRGAALAAAVAGAGRAGRTALLVAGGVGGLAILATGAIVVTGRSGRNLVRDALDRVGVDADAARAATVERFAGDVQRVVTSPLASASIGATSVGIWAVDVLTAVVVLRAVGVGVALPTLVGVSFLAVSVGNLAKVLPLSPGGIGLYEAAFTLLVVALTPIAGPVAFGAAVLDHAVKNLVTIAGGVASMLLLNVSLTSAAEESTEVTTTARARDGLSRQD